LRFTPSAAPPQQERALAFSLRLIRVAERHCMSPRHCTIVYHFVMRHASSLYRFADAERRYINAAAYADAAPLICTLIIFS